MLLDITHGNNKMKLNSINHTLNQSNLKRTQQTQNTSFGTLYFKNDKVREKAMDNGFLPSFLEKTAIKNTIQQYNVLVEDANSTKILYRGCKDIIQKGDDLVAVGFRAPVLKYPQSSICNYIISNSFIFGKVGVPIGRLLSGTLDKEDMFNRLIFKNKEVKENFLESLLSHVFYGDSAIKELFDKGYQVVITEAKPKKISFVASTDIFSQNDNITPSGYKTCEVILNNNRMYNKSKGRIVMVNESGNYFENRWLSGYLDNLLECTGNNPKKVKEDIFSVSEDIADEV